MISGSIVAMVTPMADDGSVSWDQLEKLVEWHFLVVIAEPFGDKSVL